MRKLIVTILSALGFLIIADTAIAQNWTLKSEKGFTIKADNGGQFLDVVAVLDEGDDCFMDIKVINGNDMIPVKLIASDSIYIPVAAVTTRGQMMPLVGIGPAGENFNVKGISRFGNVIRISTVSPSGDFSDISAISTDGRTRKVSGVKFKDENVELEYGSTRIIAHVKAMPSVDIATKETSWDLKAVGNDGSELEVVAVNKQGKEFPVKALSAGGSFTMLNVKALLPRDQINVKLTKDNKGIHLTAIDYYGRKYPVQAKKADGSYIDIMGGENCGKSIDIRANSGGIEYIIHAVSPQGDMYDVKGIKIKDEDNEDYIQGLQGLVFFYAHVKALPPIQ